MQYFTKWEAKWSFYFVSMLLIWMYIEKKCGLHNEYLAYQQYLTLLFIIPAVAVYFLALKDKKTNFYKGTITYKQCFLSGLVITLIITILSPLTQWIISYWITPNYFRNVIAYSVKTGYFTTVAEAEAFFNYTNYATQSTIWAFISGIVTTAIVAIFVRTKQKKEAD